MATIFDYLFFNVSVDFTTCLWQILRLTLIRPENLTLTFSCLVTHFSPTFCWFIFPLFPRVPCATIRVRCSSPSIPSWSSVMVWADCAANIFSQQNENKFSYFMQREYDGFTYDRKKMDILDQSHPGVVWLFGLISSLFPRLFDELREESNRKALSARGHLGMLRNETWRRKEKRMGSKMFWVIFVAAVKTSQRSKAKSKFWMKKASW